MSNINDPAAPQPRTAPTVVKLCLSPDRDDEDRDQIKVEWQDEQKDEGWDPYLISLQNLLDCSAEVRTELAGLVAVVKQNGRGHCGKQLAGLAKAGAELYELLFTPTKTNPVPEVAKAWLREDIRSPA